MIGLDLLIGVCAIGVAAGLWLALCYRVPEAPGEENEDEGDPTTEASEHEPGDD